MEKKLNDLADISVYFGKNPEYVIAGGGNTSYKNENHIWIKASGTSLAAITPEGFVKLDRACLAKISVKNYSADAMVRESEVKKDLYDCIAEETTKRPSVETSLHNLLNFAFVVHTHPTLVNGLMCAINSSNETRSIFGEKALLVEYTDPGYILFKLVEKKVLEFKRTHGREPQIIFLENHGVFVSSDSVAEIKELYQAITEKINNRILLSLPSDTPIPFSNPELAESLSQLKNLKVKAYNSPIIKEFTCDEQSFRQASTAFTPDNIVYCKAHYLFTKPALKNLLEDYDLFERYHGYPPRVIAIENEGILCLEENEQSAQTVYEVFLDMLKISWYTANFGGPREMTAEQIEFIDTWEVENYRRKIAKDAAG